MILQLKNVESAYGLSQILFGVNLEVREGEVCCLLGRNGVGKSTTIKTIMGQVKPKGRISRAGNRSPSTGWAFRMCRRAEWSFRR